MLSFIRRELGRIAIFAGFCSTVQTDEIARARELPNRDERSLVECIHAGGSALNAAAWSGTVGVLVPAQARRAPPLYRTSQTRDSCAHTSRSIYDASAHALRLRAMRAQKLRAECGARVRARISLARVWARSLLQRRRCLAYRRTSP